MKMLIKIRPKEIIPIAVVGLITLIGFVLESVGVGFAKPACSAVGIIFLLPMFIILNLVIWNYVYSNIFTLE